MEFYLLTNNLEALSKKYGYDAERVLRWVNSVFLDATGKDMSAL